MSLICEACGHMPRSCTCGLSLVEKLRTVQLGSGATETRTKRSYYDDEPVSELFGGMRRDERKQRYMDDTKGLGAAYRDKTGNWFRKGDGHMVPVTDREATEVYANSPVVDET